MIDYKLLFFAPLQKKKCAQLFFKSLYSTLSVHFVYPYVAPQYMYCDTSYINNKIKNNFIEYSLKMLTI